MSTIQAKEKLEYYPTPECMIDAIARYLHLPYQGTIHAIDPCAGTGTALARLVKRLKEQAHTAYPYSRVSCQTYGIEPERQRARAALEQLDHVIHGSYFGTTLSTGDGVEGGWQVAFVNPPYDYDTEHSEVFGKKQRLEITFLERSTYRLCSGGILIWIVPQRCLKAAAHHLAGWYDEVQCLRFPDDLYRPDPRKKEEVSLYGLFGQVVLFARKRAFEVQAPTATLEAIKQWAELGPALAALPCEGCLSTITPYRIPTSNEQERRFQPGSYAPDATAHLVDERTEQGTYKTGVWASQEYLAARIPSAKSVGLGIGTPLTALKNAHLAVLSVAGIANRAILTGKDGRQVIVKGFSRKVPVEHSYETEEEVVKRTTDTFEAALWCIDLETGRFICVATGQNSPLPFQADYETMDLPSFLTNFGASLSEQVAGANPPRYGGEHQVPWISTHMQDLKRRPIGKQREIIAATVHGLVNEYDEQRQEGQATLLSRSAMVAEMSTGKTFLALSSVYFADPYACGATQEVMPGTRLQHLFPLIVLCPPIMARKWKREAEQTIPGVKAIIVKRMGTPSLNPLKGAKKQADADEDEEISTINDLAQFRQFDPEFMGDSLSALACLDRTVARIQRELATWKRRYQEALADGSVLPKKPCHLVILTTSVAKRSMEWMPLYRLKVARMYDRKTQKVRLRRDAMGQTFSLPCCPSCFRVIIDEKMVNRLKRGGAEQRDFFERLEERWAQGTLTPYEEETLLPLECIMHERDLLGNRDHRVKRFCTHCGEALWQYVPVKPTKWQPFSILTLRKEDSALPLPDRDDMPPCLTSSFRRPYPLGTYILRRYKHFFHMLLADEVHEGSDGTALDFARQRLVNACGRTIGLTGTLSNGYSASLFRLYYTLNQGVRETFGYHEVERWIDLYGKRQTTEKTYKEKELGDGATSDRRIGAPVIREIAGFAPQGLAHILPCSTFLELSDVSSSLPSYDEYVHIIDMDQMLAEEYSAFEESTTRELGRMLAYGDTSGLSAWWNGLLNYPNMPYRGWVTRVKSSDTVLGSAAELPQDFLYAKERAVIQYVQQEMTAGRRVLIYTENTGTLDIMPRLKKILESKVTGRANKPINVAILRSTTVETINREAWLEDQVEEGCDVLICNPKLVKVGLDLIAFPTILYVSIPKSTSDLRQSSRRSHRLGQTQPVKVNFFVYRTMEKDLLKLMSQKMKASLMVEGKLPGEGLVSFGEEESENETDLFVQLARQILANIEAGQPRQREQEDRELRELFRENAQIEREKQQALGQEALAEPVEAEPIQEIPLPPGEEIALSEEATPEPVSRTSAQKSTKKKHAVEGTEASEVPQEVSLPQKPDALASGEEVVEPVVAQETTGEATSTSQTTNVAASVTRKHAAKKETKQSSGTVTIIHTAVTSGKDPWADLRAKYVVSKKRRKPALPTGQEELPNLWSGIVARSSLPSAAPDTADTTIAEEHPQLHQHTLW